MPTRPPPPSPPLDADAEHHDRVVRRVPLAMSVALEIARARRAPDPEENEVSRCLRELFDELQRSRRDP